MLDRLGDCLPGDFLDGPSGTESAKRSTWVAGQVAFVRRTHGAWKAVELAQPAPDVCAVLVRRV